MSDEGSDQIDIHCKVTKWYFKRMGLMFLMFAGMGLWFLKDGIWTWPKEKEIYEEYVKFKDSDRLEEWQDYATENGYDSQPDERTQKDVDGQFHFAYGMGACALVVLAFFLMNRKKELKADQTSFYTPSGKQVPFKDVFRVDKRKWDNKGLAYATYKEEGGASKKATLDDLKYEGADKILDRLMDNFEGELIERIPDEEEEESPGEESSDGAKDSSETGESPENPEPDEAKT